jgi:hypothetical protein
MFMLAGWSVEFFVQGFCVVDSVDADLASGGLVCWDLRLGQA